MFDSVGAVKYCGQNILATGSGCRKLDESNNDKDSSSTLNDDF